MSLIKLASWVISACKPWVASNKPVDIIDDKTAPANKNSKRIKSWIIAGRVAYIPFILIMIHSKGK